MGSKNIDLIAYPFLSEESLLVNHEIQYKEEFQVEMETSKYGRFITGLKGIKTTDMKNGPWWMYAHKSPSQNLNRKVGDAPGADALGLFDKDEVEFVFTNKFGE